ncbi:MAG TPA: protocatechuate 3,4-dioxygenase [Burkholderiales bacterium]
MSGADSATRRRILRCLALGALAAATARGTRAAPLIPTPRQTAGPFYPRELPLDRDNDLIVIGERGARAAGLVTHLRGRILDRRGDPVRNAVVEIWQVDANGVYLHPGSAHHDRRDANFQGFGRFETASSGEYYFRTIKPVPYPGRTPHIHFAVHLKGAPPFTTQCYVAGEPLNERDAVLNSIRDPEARRSVIVPFAPIRASPSELAARFDIVLGFTPAA